MRTTRLECNGVKSVCGSTERERKKNKEREREKKDVMTRKCAFVRGFVSSVVIRLRMERAVKPCQESV